MKARIIADFLEDCPTENKGEGWRMKAEGGFAQKVLMWRLSAGDAAKPPTLHPSSFRVHPLYSTLFSPNQCQTNRSS
jgi:hypothetical protein